MKEHHPPQKRKHIEPERRGGTRGLPKNHKCHLCPMSYHDPHDLVLHIRHWHGIWDNVKLPQP